jgi:hypothetical protein
VVHLTRECGDVQRSWQWIGRDFVYGDLVHADADGSRDFSLRSRYNAALQLAAQVVLLNNLTLLTLLDRGVPGLQADDPVWREVVDLGDVTKSPVVPEPFPWTLYEPTHLTVSVSVRRRVATRVTEGLR